MLVSSVCWLWVPDAWTAGYLLAQSVCIDVGCYVLPHEYNMLPQHLPLTLTFARKVGDMRPCDSTKKTSRGQQVHACQ